MSSSLFDRLLLTSIKVKDRLKSVLRLCRIYEHPSYKDDDQFEEFYRFNGPDHSDIEELENCISKISSTIENLQHELETNGNNGPFQNYPLCNNGWTLKDIEQSDRIEPLNLTILKYLSLLVLSQYDMTVNERYSLNTFENESVTHKDPVITNVDTSLLTNSTFNLSNETNKNLLDMPPEVLLHIISFLTPAEYLTNLAPTCRYLANFILNNVLEDIHLAKIISVFEANKCLSYLPYLRSITFFNWDNEVSNLTWAIWFDRIAHTTTHLHKICFRHVHVSPILICYIVEYFSHCLQTITFDYQQNKGYEKFDLILSLLADSSMQLKHITASYQTGITNFGILQLANNLNSIVELNLLYIEAINDETMKVLCNKHSPYLKVLKIDGAQLTDKALEYIDCCRNLRSIMIEFCTNMLGTNFQIFKNLTHLEELSLSKLTAVPLELFQLLFNGMYSFEHLTLLKLGECHSIDNDCIRSIIKMCPRLVDFTCTWAYSLTDDSFNEIVIHCSGLQRLSLVGCHQINGKILENVPKKYLKNIQYMNFEQCNQINDDLLVDLYKRKKTIAIVNYYGTTIDDEDANYEHNIENEQF